MERAVWSVIEPSDEGNRASYLFGIFITAVILLNITAMILSSVTEIHTAHPIIWIILRLISASTLIIFVIEYLLRIWSCSSDPQYAHPVTGRLKWAATPYALIDLLVILPYFLLLFGGINLTGLVILRVFRLFKLMRYSESINLIIRVIKAEKNTLFTTYLVLFIVLIAAATLMYEVEYPAQPEAFSNIPAAMWWGVITLTTTGYGDIVPITPLGKMLGSMIALIGIAIFALPAGILASGFSKALQIEIEDEEVYLCPHCKEEIRRRDLWKK
ncbi:MAG: ion transporter [Methanocalculus sp.]|uniref:ion transporter n=1 Tax=Methanocalculus sp. TaxID=2004547 RepID=UPI00271CC997|nr:ion transporter [Methanocalculus sp.]MDO9539632.1 ion transporter [Methanocalculus sp.]